MSIRNLERLFKPRSMALVGASKEKGSLGAVLARNLFNAGFAGPIMPVNPRYQAIQRLFAKMKDTRPSVRGTTDAD